MSTHFEMHDRSGRMLGTGTLAENVSVRDVFRLQQRGELAINDVATAPVLEAIAEQGSAELAAGEKAAGDQAAAEKTAAEKAAGKPKTR